MYLTQKIRIYPSREQKGLLWILSEKCRLIYNFALQERKENWLIQKKKPKKDRWYITYKEQSARLPELKFKFPEYKWVYSKVLQQCVKKLDENFKSFFSKQMKGDITARPPKFKGKHYFTTLCYNQSGFKLKNNGIIFSHKHPSRIALLFIPKYPIIREGCIKQVEIKYYPKGKWYMYITREIFPTQYIDNGLYYAIDLGVSNLVSGINLHLKTIQIKNRRADLYWRMKIPEVQSKRDHCIKGSHRWHKYNNTFRKMKGKCATQMKDFQHFIAKKIIKNTRANTIIIGDLSAKQMVRKKKGKGIWSKSKANRTLNNSIQNTGSIGRFIKFLTYKAEKEGKRVIRIDESYTSRTCSLCGNVKKMPLFKRKMNCNCGNRMDRDINSAINIMVRFIDTKGEIAKKDNFLLQKPSMTEESFLKRLDLLRQTAPWPLNTDDGGLAVS